MDEDEAARNFAESVANGTAKLAPDCDTKSGMKMLLGRHESGELSLSEWELGFVKSLASQDYMVKPYTPRQESVAWDIINQKVGDEEW